MARLYQKINGEAVPLGGGGSVNIDNETIVQDEITQKIKVADDITEKLRDIYANGFASRNLAKLDNSANINASFWNYSSKTESDISATTEDSSASKFLVSFKAYLENGETYFVSGEGTNLSSGNNIFIYADKTWGTQIQSLPLNSSFVFSGVSGEVVIGIFAGTNTSASIKNFQLEKNEKATIYTPYAKSNVELTRGIKRADDVYKRGFASQNLFKNDAISGEGAGIAFDVNKDGSVYIHGTLTAIESNFNLYENGMGCFEAGKTYKVTAFTDAPSSGIRIQLFDAGNGYIFIDALEMESTKNEKLFSIPSNMTLVLFRLNVVESGALSSLVKIVITEENEEVDFYTQYAKSNVEITEELAKKSKWKATAQITGMGAVTIPSDATQIIAVVNVIDGAKSIIINCPMIPAQSGYLNFSNVTTLDYYCAVQLYKEGTSININRAWFTGNECQNTSKLRVYYI